MQETNIEIGNIEQNGNTQEMETEAVQHFEPTAPEDYEIPSGLFYDESMEKGFREAMAGANCSKEQASAFLQLNQSWQDNIIEKFREKRQQEFKAGHSALKEKWGKNTEANLARAVQFSNTIYDKFPSLKEELVHAGLDNSPLVTEFFSWLGGFVAEDSLAGKITSGNNKKTETYNGEPVWTFEDMRK